MSDLPEPSNLDILIESYDLSLNEIEQAFETFVLLRRLSEVVKELRDEDDNEVNWAALGVEQAGQFYCVAGYNTDPADSLFDGRGATAIEALQKSFAAFDEQLKERKIQEIEDIREEDSSDEVLV